VSIPTLEDQPRLLRGSVGLILSIFIVVTFFHGVFLTVVVIFFILLVFTFGLLDDAGVFGFSTSPKSTPRLRPRTRASSCAGRRPWS
jgi:hypothetical protein